MTGSPVVTVVIPTHNRADYIGAAIESVLAQTLDRIEIIVVDDESTDDTRERVLAYGDRVSYTWTPNGGSAHARNVGMLQARGRYIAFLDSDDLYYPYALELLVNVLERHPDVGMAYAEMSGFDDAGFFERYHLKTYHRSAYWQPGLTYERIFAGHMTLAEAGVLPPGLLAAEPELADRRAYFGRIFDWYLTRTVLFHNNIVLRRALVPAVGLRNTAIKYWEELDFALRICRTEQVAFVDVPTYKLRYHPGQLSSTDGEAGRYVWVRKQQVLLRVIRRQALEVPSYFQRHRARLHQHLAHLHRAVAVPLLLFEPRSAAQRDYASKARLYLARCRRYGHPQRLLWLSSHLPGPARRFAVSVIERVRRVARSLGPSRTPVAP